MIIKDVTVNRDGRGKTKKRWKALKGHTELKASVSPNIENAAIQTQSIMK